MENESHFRLSHQSFHTPFVRIQSIQKNFEQYVHTHYTCMGDVRKIFRFGYAKRWPISITIALCMSACLSPMRKTIDENETKPKISHANESN